MNDSLSERDKVIIDLLRGEGFTLSPEDANQTEFHQLVQEVLVLQYGDLKEETVLNKISGSLDRSSTVF